MIKGGLAPREGLCSARVNLHVRGLKKSILSPAGTRQVLFELEELVLKAGEELCVRGNSGSGKTTLLHVLAGLTTADAGRVEIAGEDLLSLGEAARDRVRSKYIGYIFQQAHLLPALTALENVMLPLEFGGFTRGEAKRRAEELCERLGLGDRKQAFSRTLSGGEQQRVALARAVACKPKLLLADEPTASLDEESAEQALTLLREVASEVSASLILVTHDRAVASRFERQLVLGRAS